MKFDYDQWQTELVFLATKLALNCICKERFKLGPVRRTNTMEFGYRPSRETSWNLMHVLLPATLAKPISETLAEFRGRADDEMEMFALDCHPWNGGIVLAFLTHSEVKDSPSLSDLAEMASWKYFDFSADLASWQPALGIASRMRPVYEAEEEEEENRHDVIRQFLQRCAQAVASKSVQDMLTKYRLAKSFKITVQHPDTREEFYPPK